MTGSNLFVSALALLFLFGGLRAVQTHLFVRRSVRMRAKVRSTHDATVHNPEASSQSAPVFRHVVELPGRDGKNRRVPLSDAVGGALSEGLIGQDGTIAVLFDPLRPEVVRIDAIWVLYLTPALLCAPGLLFLILYAYVWLAM